MASSIHPLACVDPKAELGKGVEVGPFAVIEADARVGDGCRIGPHAIVASGARMGRENVVYSGAFVGNVSQDSKFRGETAYLKIGDRNQIREAVTLNCATGEGLSTVIGSDCIIMAYAHVAHNCTLGDHVVMANSATLAGWVDIEDYAIVGGLSAIHQFCRVGAHAIAGGKTKITKDIPPFILADGHPARPYGLNRVGLRRRGFTEDVLVDLRRAYRTLYQSSLLLEDALAQLRKEFPGHTAVAHLVEFIEGSQRGVIRPRR